MSRKLINTLATFELSEDNGTPAHVSRELFFDQDADGSWLVAVIDPDTVDDDGVGMVSGSVRVKDPNATALIEALYRLLVSPQNAAPSEL